MTGVQTCALPISSVFCGVLELHEDRDADSGGTASSGGSGSMGICGLSVPVSEAAVYVVCGADADAVSGDHAVQLPGVEWNGTDQYACSGHTACGILHVSGFFDLSGILHTLILFIMCFV